MLRRDLLKLIPALPFAGLALKEAPAEAAYSITDDLDYPRTNRQQLIGVGEDPINVIPGFGAGRMAEMLSANLGEYIARHNPESWDAEQIRIQHLICRRFCSALLTKEEAGGINSGAYMPHQDPHLVDKVVFGVTTGPIATIQLADGKTQTKPCLARKIRMNWSPDLAQDLTAFCGIDYEAELVGCAAEQAALEVKMEIRHDFENGVMPKVYCLYLPPFLSPVDPKMLENFSVCRRFMIRYAKFH